MVRLGQIPEPDSADMYHKDRPRPPKFVTRIKPQTQLQEAQPAHFECRLVPIGDPDMKVEWFKDGQLLRAGEWKNLVNFFYLTNLVMDGCFG